jgi:hypothetical protein
VVVAVVAVSLVSSGYFSETAVTYAAAYSN